jgi:Ca2+-binding RTX toxin-like protein
MTIKYELDCCPDIVPDKPFWEAAGQSPKADCFDGAMAWKTYPQLVQPVPNSIGTLTGYTLADYKGPAWSLVIGPDDGAQGVSFHLPAILDMLVDGFKTQGYPTEVDGIPVFLCFDGRQGWNWVVDTTDSKYDPDDPEEWVYKLEKDMLNPGTGNDSVVGGTNADELFGGGGDDFLNGNKGNDWVFGDEGNDTLLGGAGHDLIDGGSGDDVINGGSGMDSIDGGSGNDTIDGGTGMDCIKAGEGDDVVTDFFGASQVDGGDGNDDIRTGNWNDTVDGGKGDDLILTNGGADDVCGGEGNDTIRSGDGDDEVDAGAGNDLVNGGNGNDSLEGGDGDDTILGADGDDLIVDGAGNDTLWGGDGDDVIYMGAGNDVATGGAGCDTFVFTDCFADECHKNLLGKQDKIFDFNILEGDKIDLTCVKNLDWMDVIRFDADTLILNGYYDAGRDDVWTADDYQIFQIVVCGTNVGNMGINDTFYSAAHGSGPVLLNEYVGVDLPTNDDIEFPGLFG